MRKLLIPFAVAFALTGCSADNSVSGKSALTGGDAFLELVQDARIAIEGGNLPEAGQLYDKARELEPENPGLWVDIARLRFRGGEHLIAIEAADYALELDPEYAPALLLRAQLVRDSNGLAESLPWFEAAIAADPRNPEAMGDYAATLGDLGRYSDMLEVVRDLTDFAPDYSQAHFLQAVLAARGEDPVLASNLLSRSGLAARGVPAAMMLAAVVEMQQGNYDTAVETLEVLAQRQPGNMRVDELHARALWLGGRDREVIDRFAARASLLQASPYLVMLVGRSYERSGDRAKAIPFIERARAARSQNRFVLDGAGQGDTPLPDATAQLRDFADAGSTGAALRTAEGFLERVPYSADFHSLAGDTAFIDGNTELALERYGVASRVRRSWPLTRKIIASYNAYGDDRAAQALLSRYIAGDPHNTDALFLLAQTSAQQEDWLRVAVLLDNAIELGAGNDLRVLSLRAQAARALGNEDEGEALDALRAELAPPPFLPS